MGWIPGIDCGGTEGIPLTFQTKGILSGHILHGKHAKHSSPKSSNEFGHRGNGSATEGLLTFMGFPIVGFDEGFTTTMVLTKEHNVGARLGDAAELPHINSTAKKGIDQAGRGR